MKKCNKCNVKIDGINFSLYAFILLCFTFAIVVVAFKTISNTTISSPTITPIVANPSLPPILRPSEPDVLLNPYSPPLRDERYLPNPFMGMPINISTNPGAVDTSYRQVGILTPLKGQSNGQILPLMGRPLFTNRQKWQYYTISNQRNGIKLPIKVKGRSATDEYGVDEIFSQDIVFVEGNREKFKATVYDNDTIRYLPFL